MTAAAFDTLKLAKRLAAAGMPPVQAEGVAEGLSEVMVTELATKGDLRELRDWATVQFAQQRVEVAQSKNETIRWMIGLFLAQSAVVIGAVARLAG